MSLYTILSNNPAQEYEIHRKFRQQDVSDKSLVLVEKPDNLHTYYKINIRDLARALPTCGTTLARVEVPLDAQVYYPEHSSYWLTDKITIIEMESLVDPVVCKKYNFERIIKPNPWVHGIIHQDSDAITKLMASNAIPEYDAIAVACDHIGLSAFKFMLDNGLSKSDLDRVVAKCTRVYLDVVVWLHELDVIHSQVHAIVKSAASTGQVDVLAYLLTNNYLSRRPIQTRMYSLTISKLASQYNHLNVLQWWAASGMELTYTTETIDESKHNPRIYDWWQKRGLGYNYTVDQLETMKKAGVDLSLNSVLVDYACAQSNFAVLKWWRESGTSMYYHDYSITRAAFTANYELLEFWKSIGEPFDTSDILWRASESNNIAVLDWMAKSKMNLTYDHRTLVSASKAGHVNVLNWWDKSGFVMKFNYSVLESEHTNVVDWWYSRPKLIMKIARQRYPLLSIIRASNLYSALTSCMSIGRIDVVDGLLDDFKFSPDQRFDAFVESCKYDIEMIRVFYQHLPLLDSLQTCQIMISAASKNQVSVIFELYNLLLPSHAVIKNLFDVCCSHGYTEIIDWIFVVCQDLVYNQTYALSLACIGGHLETARALYLRQTCSVDKIFGEVCNCWNFSWNHVAVLNWLCELQSTTNLEINVKIGIFVNACTSGKTPLVKWCVETWKINDNNIDLTDVLMVVCEKNYIEIADIVITNFSHCLRVLDIDCIFGRAVQFKNLSLAKLVVKTWPSRVFDDVTISKLSAHPIMSSWIRHYFAMNRV